ncbi:MAG: hypothetical protein M3Y07_11160, partial [Acidobacteriota bacterium]|nr:hypothetical protein [Acidobacteriota bacterium]
MRRKILVIPTMALLSIHPATGQNDHKIVVTPGTPSVWSLEQAHYLLNRVRANNDGVRTKTPGDGDLDPNAIHGLRLDALQSFFGASAGFEQISG